MRLSQLKARSLLARGQLSRVGHPEQQPYLSLHTNISIVADCSVIGGTTCNKNIGKINVKLVIFFQCYVNIKCRNNLECLGEDEQILFFAARTYSL